MKTKNMLCIHCRKSMGAKHPLDRIPFCFDCRHKLRHETADNLRSQDNKVFFAAINTALDELRKICAPN